MNDVTQNPKKGIGVVFWNARSISNKLDNFKITIGNSYNKVFCITESWLKPNMDSSFLEIEGFKTFRNDRQLLNRNGFLKRGGGILIYALSDLDTRPISDESLNFSDQNIELLTIQIILPFTRPLYILTVYRPPTGNIELFIEKIQQICDQLPKRHLCDIVIGGDFNINFAKANKEDTKKLKKFMKKNSLRQIVEVPTRPLYNDAIIDLILTNTNKAQASGILDWNLSDHLPTFINIKKEKAKFSKIDFQGRSYKNFDEDEFIRLLQEADINNILQNNNVDIIWRSLRTKIEGVLDQIAPIKTFKFRNSKPGWLSNDLIEMMHDRDVALKRARKSKNIEVKKHARSIRNLVNHYIKQARSEYIKEQLENLKDKPKKFWNIINDIINPSNKSNTFKLTDDQGNCMGDAESAETINNYFANIGKNLAEKIIWNQSDVLHEIGQLKPPTFELPLIDLQTVYKITSNIKEYKSSGMSSISSKIWKVFANSYNDLFVHLYNLICTQAHYPDEWKIATVVPLPKTPNANKPGDLRPISLLPLPGKILEHHIHDSLQVHLDNNNLISKFQNGFRKNHSTQQTIFKYTTDLLLNNNNNETSIAIYIDFRKAFDTVNHKKLINKISKYGISQKLTKLLQSYLTNRKQQTVVNGTKSTLQNVGYGVPQGSILGPQLFTLYINDIVDQITESKIQMYADDIVLYNTMTNLESLKNDMSKIACWCRGSELTMNLDKTKYQIFPRNAHVDTNKLSDDCEIKVGQQSLKEVKLYKYLGVEIDNYLTMKQHANNIIKLGSHKLFILRHIRKTITMQAALLVFKSIFLGVLDYGAIFLSSLPEHIKDDIQVLQNNALRSCLNILDPRDMNVLELHANVNVQLFRNRLVKYLLICIRNAVYDGTLSMVNTGIRTRQDGHTIKLPIPRTKYIRKSPFYWGSQIWNSLPLHIRISPDKLSFKQHICDLIQHNRLRLVFPV